MRRQVIFIISVIICIFMIGTSCKKKYTVTFFDKDGLVLDIQEIKKGASAVEPNAPSVKGYTFVGWDQEFDNIISDLKIKSIYEINKYKVVFKDLNDNIIKEEIVSYNESVIAPNAPKEEGYTFVEWDQDLNNIQEDLEVKPIYNTSVYKVVFKDINGIILKQLSVKYGQTVEAPIAPTIIGKTFVGWNKDFSFIQEDLEIIPVYDTNKYKVVYKDYNGNNIKEVMAEHGSSVEAPTAPEKEGYTFMKWDQEADNVRYDLEIRPIYEINKYKVVFKNISGDVIKEEMVEHGGFATAPADPAAYGKDFIGWDQEFSNVKGNLEINPIFKVKTFTVTFKDKDKNIIKEEIVEYGKDATAPELPVVDGFNFLGWDKEYTNVLKDLTITALYEQIFTYGTIEYFDGSNELDLSPKTYDYGDSVMLPIPEKEGYYFVGWYLSERSLTEYFNVDENTRGNLTFYARFIEIERNIVLPDSTFKFTGIEKKLHSSGTFYVYQPKFPVDVASGVTNYNWSTSDPKIATVSAYSSISAVSAGYCVLTATHKTNGTSINCLIKSTSEGISFATIEEANNLIVHNVVFKGKNGEILKETKCHDNGAVIYPSAPVYDGYMFTGWDKINYNITEDTVITATYKEGTSKYEGKTFAIIGDSISTYENYIPEGFDAFYPYPTADVTDVNKTWWMQTINALGGTMFSNNSYSGTCVVGGGDSTNLMSRLEHTLVSGQAPDVILIYMGSNDCASMYVTYAEFVKAYAIMIKNLKKLCPNSEIILCTLADSPFYEHDDMIEYNNVIRSNAKEFDLKLIDMEDISLHGKLVDSAHPNTDGMTVIADKIIEELTKE